MKQRILFIAKLLKRKLMTQEYTYNAGVLIIGSLYWDSNNNRDTWRLSAFGESYWLHTLDVKAPLFYGRYSDERKCPTMIFHRSQEVANNLGNALFLPFRIKNLSLDQLLLHAQNLSEAEGKTSRLLIKGGQTKWCIVLAFLNPAMSDEKRISFTEFWTSKYDPIINQAIIDNFKFDNAMTVFDSSGLLELDWPKELVDIDVLFATQTQPKIETGGKLFPQSIDATSNQIFLRPEYFIKNRLHGITTYEDNEIINLLKRKEFNNLISNALKDGCSPAEIDIFLQQNEFTNA